MAYLEAGPADSLSLARDVLGVARGGRTSAERLAVTLLGADPRVERERDGRWTLARTADASPRLDECRFAVVDVETTGVSPAAGGRIIEIAVAVLQRGCVSLEIDALVNAGLPIPRVVRSLTGITDDQLRRAPSFERLADRVLGVLAGSVFVAHNVRHDWSFVAAELLRARDLLLAGPRLCTVKLARRLLPDLTSRGLDAVAFALGIEIDGRHRAGGDARATALVLARLLAMARERGAGTLADLQRINKSAECGVRSAEWKGRVEPGTTPPDILRIPHSAFRTPQ